MADLHSTGSDNEGFDSREDTDFIREKIVRPPLTKRQVAKRCLIDAGFGVLFGVSAAIALCAVKPVVESKLGSHEKKTPIAFSEDHPGEGNISGESISGEETPSESDAAAQAAQESAEQAQQEKIDEAAAKAVEKYRSSSDYALAVEEVMRTAARDADAGIVTVSPVDATNDIFGNPVSIEKAYAGAIIAKTDREILILTDLDAVKNTSSVTVTFGTGDSAQATLKGKDALLEMAVISIDPSALRSQTVGTLKVLEPGNSYAVQKGDMVVAAGAPIGRVHAVDYGSVALTEDSVIIPDGTIRAMHSSCSCNYDKGTFLINREGKLIGFSSPLQGPRDGENGSVFCGISEYKQTLERMSNGSRVPWFGAYYQNVTEMMQDNGAPEGVYITEVVNGSPAYAAGIQSGDVIVGAGKKIIARRTDLQDTLSRTEPGSEMTITAMRPGRDGYSKLSFKVTIGER